MIELQRRDYDAMLEACEERSDATGVFVDATERIKQALCSAWRATRTDHLFIRYASGIGISGTRTLRDAVISPTCPSCLGFNESSR